MFKKIIAPRISEINGAGHVGHNIIPVWLEEGYIEIIKLFNPDFQGKTGLFMVNINIDFMHEILLGKDVEIITGVKKIGNSSFVLNQNIFQAGKLCAKGATTFVNSSSVSKKSKAIPLSVVKKLREHILED